MVLDPTSNKFYESLQKLADFPYELKRKISELCEQKLPQAGFKDNQIEDVKSALAIRIYSDKSPFKLTSSLLDKVNRLPFDEENPPRIFLPKDLFLHAQNADFETTKHYIENNLACGYARQGKAKIFKYDELNRDTKLFGIPRGNNEMEDGEPGLLLKTIKDLYTFSPLVAFWEAEKLLNPDDEIADKFKELIDKDKRKNYSDPYFNFPLDLSGVVLVFIITDMNKFPNVFKNKLDALHVPPDLIQSTIRHANFPQQNASNSHASASTSANSSLASPPIDPATATFPNIILGASQSRHMTGITRQALGRKASIGDFYDARSDTIIENTLPFPENLLAVSYHSFDNKSLNEMWGDSFEEKFRHLQVEDELQASYHARYLLGFDVDGHANFIFRRQKKQEIFYTLIYRHRTQ
uniref:Uncharacterized protein n=1 Tax=Acrobeloides nanus TaxID=290746 RepID=A0A914CXC0_9BILA